MEIDANLKRANTQPIPLPGLPAVAPFDYDMLPDALSPWARDISERLQCPPDFVAAGIMASLAAVVGRKVGIRPQGKTSWTVVPNIWACIVGRPGVLKSPALEDAVAPLNRLIARAQEKYDQEEKRFKVAAMAAKLRMDAAKREVAKKLGKYPEADITDLLMVEEPEPPILRRYKTNDSSHECLAELLRQNPQGFMVYRDELISLLRNLDREDKAEARGFFLTAWNGDSPYTVDRIGRGTNLHVPAVCLSLLGGTQPGRLADYVARAASGAANDGLIQRFGLMVWPDTPKEWKDVDRKPDTAARDAAFQVFDRLNAFDPASIGAEQDLDMDGNPEGVPYLRFDKDALPVFREWRTKLEGRLRDESLHAAMEEHLSKYRKLIPALALLTHLADGGGGPVGRLPMLKALTWSDYLESHAGRIYGAGIQPEVTAAKAILRRIKQGDLPQCFPGWKVWRPGWSGLDRERAEEGLRLLVDYGWLEPGKSPTGGRPKTEYKVVEGAV